jgi:N-methylhydantoinase B
VSSSTPIFRPPAAPSRPSQSPGLPVNARPPAQCRCGQRRDVIENRRRRDAFGEAIDVPAQGQGTMNNVTLGNDRFTYYETIGGGQGACPDADG